MSDIRIDRNEAAKYLGVSKDVFRRLEHEHLIVGDIVGNGSLKPHRRFSFDAIKKAKQTLAARAAEQANAEAEARARARAQAPGLFPAPPASVEQQARTDIHGNPFARLQGLILQQSRKLTDLQTGLDALDAKLNKLLALWDDKRE